MTEQKAIQGCKKQDRICQKHLFDLFADKMLMVCMRYVNNLHDAEELMLNGFYLCFRSISTFSYNGDGSLSAWLRKIMVNECLMHLRKKGRLKLESVTEFTDCDTEPAALANLEAADIYKMILELPEGYRTVLNLYIIEGYSHKEIAELLEITEGTSKSQLSKAKAMLRIKLKKNESYAG